MLKIYLIKPLTRFVRPDKVVYTKSNLRLID